MADFPWTLDELRATPRAAPTSAAFPWSLEDLRAPSAAAEQPEAPSAARGVGEAVTAAAGNLANLPKLVTEGVPIAARTFLESQAEPTLGQALNRGWLAYTPIPGILDLVERAARLPASIGKAAAAIGPEQAKPLTEALVSSAVSLPPRTAATALARDLRAAASGRPAMRPAPVSPLPKALPPASIPAPRSRLDMTPDELATELLVRGSELPKEPARPAVRSMPLRPHRPYQEPARVLEPPPADPAPASTIVDASGRAAAIELPAPLRTQREITDAVSAPAPVLVDDLGRPVATARAATLPRTDAPEPPTLAGPLRTQAELIREAQGLPGPLSVEDELRRTAVGAEQAIDEALRAGAEVDELALVRLEREALEAPPSPSGEMRTAAEVAEARTGGPISGRVLTAAPGDPATPASQIAPVLPPTTNGVYRNAAAVAQETSSLRTAREVAGARASGLAGEAGRTTPEMAFLGARTAAGAVIGGAQGETTEERVQNALLGAAAAAAAGPEALRAVRGLGERGSFIPPGGERLSKGRLLRDRIRRGASLQEAMAAEGLGSPSPTVREATARAQEALAAGRAGGLNLAKLETTDDVKRVIAQAAEAQRGVIDDARRGVITLEETRALADRLGMTPEQLVARRRGQPLNAEELVAAKGLLIRAAREAREKAAAAVGGTEVQKAEALAALERLGLIEAAVSGGQAEAARAVSAGRLVALEARQAEQYAREVLRTMGGRERVDDVLARVAAIPPGDDTALHAFARKALDPTWKDKLQEAYVMSLLTNPVTHEVNAISNTLVRLTRLAERATAGGIDFARATVTGRPQERFVGEVLPDIYGMWQGAKEGVRAGLKTFQTERPVFGATKVDTARPGAIGGRTGRIVRLPGRALAAMDEFFKAVAYGAELHARAYRQALQEGLEGEARARRIAELVADPPATMREAAEAEAVYATFQKALGTEAGSPYTARLERGISQVRDWGPMAFIVPFLRTPTNIAKFGLERSPLGFIDVIRKVRAGVRGGELSDQAAKAAFGSAVGLAVTLYAAEGLITGAGPKDPNERRALEQTGWQPYSIRIGDTYYAYDRLEPLGMLLGMAADFAEIRDAMDEDTAATTAGRIAFSVSRNLTSKTFLQGLSRALDAMQDPERYGAQFVEGLAGSLVPAGVAAVTRTLDPVVRDPDGPAEAIQARLPGLSEAVRPRRDLWGQPVEREGPSALPVRTSTARGTPADQEIVRLRLRIGRPQERVGTTELTADEYERYQTEAGALARERVNQLVALPGYARMHDDVRADLIKQVVAEARATVRSRLLRERQAARR